MKRVWKHFLQKDKVQGYGSGGCSGKKYTPHLPTVCLFTDEESPLENDTSVCHWGSSALRPAGAAQTLWSSASIVSWNQSFPFGIFPTRSPDTCKQPGVPFRNQKAITQAFGSIHQPVFFAVEALGRRVSPMAGGSQLFLSNLFISKQKRMPKILESLEALLDKWITLQFISK